MKKFEPTVSTERYVTDLSLAFNWYNQNKDKKDARSYLKDYIKKNFTEYEVVIFDKLPDNKIVNTYAWVTRMIHNGVISLKDKDHKNLDNYLQCILNTSELTPIILPEEVDKPNRPSVRDSTREKALEYIGELEGALDNFLLNGDELNLYIDLKTRSIPQPYCTFIDSWIKNKAGQFISVYESEDPDIKEAYSNLGKRKLTQIIKLISTWLEDLNRYSQFKKANRKPRVKKAKPAGVQVAKLKYKREDSVYNIRSVSSAEIVGAEQVWIFNTKYKRLSVYRSDSSAGIQVKNSTLQNYQPDNCEQKTIRNPKDILQKVISGGKVSLRRLMGEITAKETPVTGRINEDCIILRIIK